LGYSIAEQSITHAPQKHAQSNGPKPNLFKVFFFFDLGLLRMREDAK
jgi:hypothetical protein